MGKKKGLPPEPLPLLTPEEAAATKLMAEEVMGWDGTRPFQLSAERAERLRVLTRNPVAFDTFIGMLALMFGTEVANEAITAVGGSPYPPPK